MTADFARIDPGPGGQLDRIARPDQARCWRLRVPSLGLDAVLAVHGVFGGRCFGGVRIWPYGAEEAVDVACRLSRAMGAKLAFAGIEGGGAKLVVRETADLRRGPAMARVGAFVESLGGAYCCGPDMGFGPEDLAAVAGQTRHVADGDLASAAAEGVHRAIRGALGALGRELAGATVAVQGLGAVGGGLARALLASGARVVGGDVDAGRTVEGVEWVHPEAVMTRVCDVFAPCAGGGVLSSETIPTLRARLVVGAANAPLREAEDAARLHAAGVVYVPDYVANVGATIAGALPVLGCADAVAAEMAAIEPRTRALVARALAEGRAPLELADQVVEARLAAWRDG